MHARLSPPWVEYCHYESSRSRVCQSVWGTSSLEQSAQYLRDAPWDRFGVKIVYVFGAVTVSRTRQTLSGGPHQALLGCLRRQRCPYPHSRPPFDVAYTYCISRRNLRGGRHLRVR